VAIGTELGCMSRVSGDRKLTIESEPSEFEEIQILTAIPFGFETSTLVKVLLSRETQVASSSARGEQLVSSSLAPMTGFSSTHLKTLSIFSKQRTVFSFAALIKLRHDIFRDVTALYTLPLEHNNQLTQS